MEMFDGHWPPSPCRWLAWPGPWESWFAWYPVKINGERVWLKTVYRRRVGCVRWGRGYFFDLASYEYGTIFDVVCVDYD